MVATSNDGILAATVPDAAGLLGHGTATVGEVAAGAGLLPSVIRPVFDGAAACGPAFTVDTGAGHNIWIHRAIYAAPAGSVLVVSCGGGFDFGYWGEILSTAARGRDLAGIVIDGGARDSVALARIGFPVFARGLCVRGTGKDARAGRGIGVPVWIGDVVVAPGDIVLGDADGVITVPSRSQVGLLERAAARTSKEADVLSELGRGGRTLDLLGLEA